MHGREEKKTQSRERELISCFNKHSNLNIFRWFILLKFFFTMYNSVKWYVWNESCNISCSYSCSCVMDAHLFFNYIKWPFFVIKNYVSLCLWDIFMYEVFFFGKCPVILQSIILYYIIFPFCYSFFFSLRKKVLTKKKAHIHQLTWMEIKLSFSYSFLRKAYQLRLPSRVSFHYFSSPLSIRPE